MTTGSGFVLPTEGMSSTESERRDQEKDKRNERRGAWHAGGRDVLGYDQARDGTWQQRHAERVAGLPVAVVEAARSAVVAEAGARAAYQAKDKEAHDYVAKHSLSAEAARVHIELHRAETWTALVQAERAALRACVALGEIAEQVSEHLAGLAQIEPRRRAEEKEHLAAVAEIDNDERQHRATLARLGATT